MDRRIPYAEALFRKLADRLAEQGGQMELVRHWPSTRPEGAVLVRALQSVSAGSAYALLEPLTATDGSLKDGPVQVEIPLVRVTGCDPASLEPDGEAAYVSPLPSAILAVLFR